ncbi:DNA alkylation repair protein [Paenibacillus sp. LHD-117]|uniref:DNA alkylation repair protein n=1 Tax=Paenibacillus sp. LHD-117 TaxID=3071412 RepID=UPI0027DFEDD4|nr:DNA alkylation repair protein [Paenibacillus sp. LHD-117]MDQ6421334.1 DNA alkylation repair protein [Paenibacillus sp. LHD-117]
MAEPLKYIYDGMFLEQFAARMKGAWSPFDENRFLALVRGDDWESLELKARTRRITESLGKTLPADYREALDVLYLVDESCTGFPYLFFPDFVELFGMAEADWTHSMEALERFTQRSTAEYAVRPFILAQSERMAAQLLKWAEHPNEHVRRLASEGARPRLPWAPALPMFKRDPSPVLPVLKRLKADPSLYVRKSVANHLNDIAKDHPDLVIGIAKRWKGDNPLTDWIVRHACRTLIKRADPEIMELFGYTGGGADAAPLVEEASLKLSREVIALGEDVILRYAFTPAGEDGSGEPLKLRVEYGIDFVKSGGKTSLKRFLLSDREFEPGKRAEGTRTHRFADLSTRKHYAGSHVFTLWVNGVEVARSGLMLEDPKAGM